VSGREEGNRRKEEFEFLVGGKGERGGKKNLDCEWEGREKEEERR
jgi:hypothetical protein